MIADKGYDAEQIRVSAINRKMIPIIPLRSNSKKSNSDFDKYLDRLKYLVENAFARLKHFRGIVTKFDKLARNYQSMLYIACMLIWCKPNYEKAHQKMVICVWNFDGYSHIAITYLNLKKN